LPGTGWGRGLQLTTASAYSGIPVRRLWALIAAGQLPVIRIPGMRAVLLDRDDLDALLKRHKQALEAAGGGP
jgi:excisionase family DNA binding protein